MKYKLFYVGFALVAHIVATHPNAFVYAGVRDITKASALAELHQKYPGRIGIVKYVSADAEGNAQLAKEIQAKHGRVDTVIANAGMLSSSLSELFISCAEPINSHREDRYHCSRDTGKGV